jgi:DNA polymerase III epsilon subunit-like protein
VRLEDTNWVMLDTETSGIDPEKDELYEVALLDGPLEEPILWSTLVKNTLPVPHEASGIHHLTEKHLADGMNRAEVDNFLVRYFDDPADVIVAHGVRFDQPMVANEANQLSKVPWLCSLRMARHLDPLAPNHKLGTLRYRYGLAEVDLRGYLPHRAPADVIVLAHVFEHLLDLYAARPDVDVNDANFTEKLLAFVNSPITVLRMPLGKYRKQLIADITDLRYLEWMISPRGMTDLDDDLRSTIERTLIDKGVFV